MENFNNFSRRVQEIIDDSIDSSVDFCTEMLYDNNEIDDVSLIQFRKKVIGQAEYFISYEFDPQNGEIALPLALRSAIAERVNDQVNISFNFKGN